jgi:hypothetical protein
MTNFNHTQNSKVKKEREKEKRKGYNSEKKFP